MVIECIGLPGSGKSELMGLVEKELGRREVDYVNVSASLRNRISWKILRAVAGALIYLSADARWLRDRLRAVLAEQGTGEPGGSPGDRKSEERRIRSLALYARRYRKMIRSHKLYLFDEGLAGTLTMLGADRRVSEDTYRKMVLAAEKGIRSAARLVVLSELSVRESLEAVETAQKEGGRRYEAFNVPSREQFLEDYERLLEAYRSNFRVLEVNRKDGNRKNLARVFGRIRRILSEAEA